MISESHLHITTIHITIAIAINVAVAKELLALVHVILILIILLLIWMVLSVLVLNDGHYRLGRSSWRQRWRLWGHSTSLRLQLFRELVETAVSLDIIAYERLGFLVYWHVQFR